MRRERKGKTLRKTLGIVLSAVMLVSGITFMPGSAIEVQAAATTKDVNLGFGGISDPTSTKSSATAWTGSKVYYGNKLWRVLDDSGFLFSEDLLETKTYHNTFSGITWGDCTLRTYLNDSTYLDGIFTSTEQGAIKDTTVTNDDNLDYGTAGGNNTTDKLFLLSLAEVKNSDYGFGSDATRAASAWWWLRSPGFIDINAALVDDGGSVNSDGYDVNNADGSVRPAFNLNLSSVLFTSASGASKSSFGVVGDSNVSNNTWKLTLERTENTLGANKTNGKTSLTAGYSAENLTISHSAATTLTDATQISAMLTDSYGTVLYYGSVNSDTTATSSTVTIPAGLAVGTYSLYVFAEDVNTGNLTDYATALGTAISINVNAAPSTYAVTVNNGTGDGNYEENATVTITADAAPSGQHFKEWTGADSLNFTSGSKTSTTATFTMPANAVTLTATYENDTPQAVFDATSDNGGQLSGITTDMKYSLDGGTTWIAATDVRVALSGVTAANDIKVYQVGDNLTTFDSDVQTLNITQADKPTGLGKTDCTTIAQNDGTITGVDTTMEYKLGTDTEWKAVTGTSITGLTNGTYNVRVKASGTTLASASTDVSIEKHVHDYGTEWKSDATNHWNECSCGEKANSAAHTFKWVIDKKATTITRGSKHEECTICGYKKTAVEIAAYKFLEGEDGTYILKSGENYKVRISGDFDKFIDVNMDGKTVATKNYTAKSGSTIITFNADYLDTLKVGKHKLTVNYTEGSAETSLTVKEKAAVAATGDNSNIILWSLLLVVCGGALAGGLYVRRRKENR